MFGVFPFCVSLRPSIPSHPRQGAAAELHCGNFSLTSSASVACCVRGSAACITTSASTLSSPTYTPCLPRANLCGAGVLLGTGAGTTLLGIDTYMLRQLDHETAGTHASQEGREKRLEVEVEEGMEGMREGKGRSRRELLDGALVDLANTVVDEIRAKQQR